jgi:hypothetical protein
VAPSDWLTHRDFAALVGDSFEMAVLDETGGATVATVATELIEATESSALGGSGPAGQTRKQFSLVFRGPAAPVLPQGTYRLSHAELGELDLFLVPIGPDAEGMRYEAVFA